MPGQDPARIAELLEAHVREHCPPGVTLDVECHGHSPAVYTDPSSDWANKARAALESTYGHAPAMVRGGGSIPVISIFQDVLGLEPLLLGTYAPGERMHSPNERYFARDFFRAIETGIRLYGS